MLATWELDQIRNLAAEKQRLVFTVHNWKFAPICRKITELISSGALGQIHHCDWQVLRTGSLDHDGRAATGDWIRTKPVVAFSLIMAGMPSIW